MIFVGNSRANGQNLARHLMSPENEHVTVQEISGFAGDDLSSAFKEAEATARGTRCQKYLFSLSLNPPASQKVGTETFLQTISQAEERLARAAASDRLSRKRRSQTLPCRLEPNRQRGNEGYSSVVHEAKADGAVQGNLFGE